MGSTARADIPFTYREYCYFPDDGRRYELMDGECYVTPAPSSRHQTVSRLLQFWLMQVLEMPRIARIFNAPIDVILSDTTVVQPDLAVVRETRKGIITARGIEAAPDLVVEIFSPSTRGRDEVLKRGIYARFGVPEYWLVDPEYCFVDVMRLSGSGYGLPARFERTATLTSLEFPEISIPLAPVFEDR